MRKRTPRYIKSKKLNAGRKISPDGKLAAATKAGSFDMLKCARVLFPTPTFRELSEEFAKFF